MYDYVNELMRLVERLRANPRIRLSVDDFPLAEVMVDPAWHEILNASMAEEYGAPFPLPAEDRQLLGLPRLFDIAWGSTPGRKLAGGRIDFLVGCLNLRDVSTAFVEPTYEWRNYHTAAEFEEIPLLRIATLFDCGSVSNTTNYLTHLLRDPATRDFQGLAIRYGWKLLPLPLGIGEYVRTGIKWYGAWGWHFLYLPLADFYQLDGGDLLTIYKLHDGLPELFPDDDWSVIEEKKDYFDFIRKYVLR